MYTGMLLELSWTANTDYEQVGVCIYTCNNVVGDVHTHCTYMYSLTQKQAYLLKSQIIT